MTDDSVSITTIDFAPILHKCPADKDWIDTAKQIDRELSKVGFVYLTNHEIPSQIFQDAFQVTKSFFDLPLEVKLMYKKKFKSAVITDGVVPIPNDYNGYIPAGDELIGNSYPTSEDSTNGVNTNELRESFDIVGKRADRICPSDAHVPEFKNTIESLLQHFNKLALKFSQVLGWTLLGPDNVNYFQDRMQALKEQSNVSGFNPLRFLSYPPIHTSNPSFTEVTRCPEHTDFILFTFLMQHQVGGLQVKNLDGKWVSAPPMKDTLLIITGELLEFWSSGHWPATIHRVQIPQYGLNVSGSTSARQSMAFFVNADDHVEVVPLKHKHLGDGMRMMESSSGLPILNAKDYVMSRLHSVHINTKEKDQVQDQ